MDDQILITAIARCTKEPLSINDLKNGTFRPILKTPEGSFLLLINPDRGDFILGRGEIKTAMFAIDLSDAQIYVVTVSKKSLCSPEKWDTLKHEISFLKQVKGIPQLLQLKTAFMNDEDCYIITNYCNGGELFNELASKKLSLLQTLQIALDLSYGLKKLHALGFIHRDIKPHNIFLNKELNGETKAVIGDFDTVCKEGDLKALEELCGNPYWLPPEKAQIIASSLPPKEQTPFWQAASTAKCDIWSLGTLFFILFRGGALTWQKLTFPEEPPTAAIQRCAHLVQSDLSKEIENAPLPSPCIPLIKKMLQIDPSKRPSAEEVYIELHQIINLYQKII
jgi:serine/threonine protein kinase